MNNLVVVGPYEAHLVQHEPYMQKFVPIGREYDIITVIGNYMVDAYCLDFATNIWNKQEINLDSIGNVKESYLFSLSMTKTALSCMDKAGDIHLCIFDFEKKKIAQSVDIRGVRQVFMCKKNQRVIIRFESVIIVMDSDSQRSVYAPNCVAIGPEAYLTKRESVYDVYDLDGNPLWTYKYVGFCDDWTVSTDFVHFENQLCGVVVFSDGAFVTMRLCEAIFQPCNEKLMVSHHRKWDIVTKHGIEKRDGYVDRLMRGDEDYICIQRDETIEVLDRYTLKPAFTAEELRITCQSRIYKTLRSEGFIRQMSAMVLISTPLPMEIASIVAEYM